jgi:RNA polymerase sigma-70 factor (ECF subfamily)
MKDRIDLEAAEGYEELRPLLFSIAYRMVGGVGDAEDLVQEAFLRLHREIAAGADIRSPRAWLTTVTTRLAINHLRSARVRRERYVGTWLPEPLLTDAVPDAAEHAEMADSLSLAFLVLLESLTPVERAVFLLREVFEYEYAEIAEVIGKSEDNCRQIAVRARRQVEARKPRFEASRARRDELARRFFQAVGNGDAEGLVRLLADDVVAYADGGGRGAAFPRPVHGRDRVLRLLLGPAARGEKLDIRSMRLVEVNGQPGAIFLGAEDTPVFVLSLDVVDGRIQAVRAIGNPDKLRHVRPTAGTPWPLRR